MKHWFMIKLSQILAIILFVRCKAVHPYGQYSSLAYRFVLHLRSVDSWIWDGVCLEKVS